MNTRMALKLVVLAILIVALFQMLQGHDFLTGLALVLALTWVVAKITFAIIAHRCGSGPAGGLPPYYTPVPIPPVRPRPPELSAAEKR